MRAFLAVDLDESLQDKVLEVQDKLKEANAAVKFVEKENMHFTCKFFGEISEDKKDKIIQIIKDRIARYNGFQINIKRLGVFPHPGYVRVIWLGLEDSGNFSKILMDFDEEFVKLGYKKERSYVPHLTIGRVKGKKNKEALVAKIKELEESEIGAMNVDKLILKKSELTPEGPIYTTVEEFKLK